MKKSAKKKPIIKINNFKWPNAYLALKGYYVMCSRLNSQEKNGDFITAIFIKDVCQGSYDHLLLKSGILWHSQKSQLQKLKQVSFNHLLASNPYLLASAISLRNQKTS